MTISIHDVHDAGRLVRWGLDVKAVPGAHEEYAELLARYRLEDAFRETVLATCAGLEIDVLSVDDQGFIIAPRMGSIFSLSTMNDWESGMDPQSRRRSGLVLLTIIAVAYPTSDALERTTVVRVRVSQVERALREAVRVIEDAEPDDSEAQTAAHEIGLMPPVKPGATRQLAKSSTLAAIRAGFEHLVDAGMARAAGSVDGDPEYQLLDRMRVNVREMVMPDTHATLLGHTRAAAVIAASAATTETTNEGALA